MTSSNITGFPLECGWMERDQFISSPNRMLRISKELKKLQFSNPGEKMRTTTNRRPRGPVGEVDSREDVCDCLSERCPGCFLPCPKCKSNMCGIVCKSGRQWDYVRELADRNH